jgi:hypothetical protein
MESTSLYSLLDAERKYLGFFVWELCGFFTVLFLGFCFKFLITGIVGSFVSVVVLRSLRQIIAKFNITRRLYFFLSSINLTTHTYGGRYFL